MLRGDLGESLIWKAAESGGFTALKDHIITMMGRALQVDKGLPLHAVAHKPADETNMEEADDLSAALAQPQTGEEQFAAVRRWKNGRAGGGRLQPNRVENVEDGSPRPLGPTGDTTSAAILVEVTSPASVFVPSSQLRSKTGCVGIARSPATAARSARTSKL